MGGAAGLGYDDNGGRPTAGVYVGYGNSGRPTAGVYVGYGNGGRGRTKTGAYVDGVYVDGVSVDVPAEWSPATTKLEARPGPPDADDGVYVAVGAGIHRGGALTADDGVYVAGIPR